MSAHCAKVRWQSTEWGVARAVVGGRCGPPVWVLWGMPECSACVCASQVGNHGRWGWDGGVDPANTQRHGTL